jgi:ABC-type uncharacterized transport system ATPase subunit
MGNYFRRKRGMRQRRQEYMTVNMQPESHRLSIHFNSAQVTASMITTRLLSVLPVNDLHIEEPSIERVIRQLYEGRLQLTKCF